MGNKYLRCTETVYPPRSFGGHQCLRIGKVQHKGKYFCKQHDPEMIKRRKILKRAEWDKAWKKKEQQWEREDLMREYFGNISTKELCILVKTKKREENINGHRQIAGSG